MKGVANHIGPESCADAREGISEALTGERAGQPSSRERLLFPDADVVLLTEGNTDGRDIASAQTVRRGRRTWHVRTLFAREPGDLTVGQQRCIACCAGPHREGEEPKPMMHDCEKSDFAVVATKPTNKAERSVAEPVERRAETKRNASEQSTHRTQSRVRVSQALERVRQHLPSDTQGRSRMPELGPYGSVRGAAGNSRPYRERRRALPTTSRASTSAPPRPPRPRG
jgi:hypothetical protein